MSVHVMIKFPGGSRDKLMEVFSRHAEDMVRISGEGKSQGAAHHAFAEDDEGNIYVIDEWTSREDFDKFFSTQEEIPKIIGEMGVTAAPVVMSYRILDTPDRF